MQKALRLAHNASFSYIYRNGQLCKSRIFLLFFVPAATVKAGISVSKKVGGSVTRNRTKRLIKEAFRSLVKDLKVKCNYVIQAKESITVASFDDISNELRRVLTKLGHL